MSAGSPLIRRGRPFDRAQLRIWSVFALALIAAPLVFRQGASLSLLSQMGTAAIFGLSYNMLLGQGGMLSFGHAMYSGLGAFAAVRVLNMAGAGAAWMPVSLVPLAGGLAGMAFGMLSGVVMTRKSGTTFAMITLGMAELVSACWLMFPEIFGGEGGIATNRVIGEPVLGVSFGPQIEVYYLIACWLFVSTAAMYAYTRTPLGRIVNAVRDNPERAGFIGYDAQWARYLTLVLSAFFAGISGGLSAINFEIVSAENVGAVRSGTVLLFTVIGGTGFFAGPMIGAAAGVFLTVMLSEFTRAWQLYIGLFFIAIVLWAPGGMASIVMANLRIARGGGYRRIWPALWRLGVAVAAAAAGVAAAIEMLYRLSLDAAGGTAIRLFGIPADAASPVPWIVAAVLACAGAVGAARCHPRFRAVWEDAHAELERRMREEQA